MSTPGPFGPMNPFEGMPIFGDLAKMFQNQGPVNWEIARQIGIYMAAEGRAESNVEPLERIRLEELARVAELHIAEKTGLATSITGRSVSIRATTRAEWAALALEAYRPLFERLAESLGRGSLSAPGGADAADLGRLLGQGADPGDEGGAGGVDPEALLGNMMQVMAPAILGMQLGLMVGHLARKALGPYDLPIPRPASDELVIVPANLEQFAADWSLPPDDVRLWVCLDAITHHAVLGRPHVRARLESLLNEYAGGFQPDPDAMSGRLERLDPSNQSSWEDVFGDPEALLGSMESPRQREIKPELEALTVTIEGYVDWVLDDVGGRLIGSYGPLSEALRRRRVEANSGDRFVERLFGLELSQRQYDRGQAFVRGVVERAGEAGLVRLWHSERELPTPPEVDAPGLWLARIDL
ncbi:MAG TPA: zinc-dependent metalloprotease [Acidimicrobiales bacterium]|nr:zinc-dependent metalloprotease [Acidimicrobiales bacterium]